MKRVVIIDSGLSSELGHNFSLVDRMLEIYSSKGFEVDIIALKNSNKFINKYLSEKSNFYPIITYNCYSVQPHQNNENFIKAVKVTTSELADFFRNKEEYDIAIWIPSTSSVQFVTNILYKINSKRNFIFINRDPLSLTKPSEFFLPRIANKAKERKDITILTTDFGAQQLYFDIFGIDTIISPIITLSKSVQNKNELKNIGIFNTSRNNEKQHKKLCNLYRIAPEINFHIHDPSFQIQKSYTHLFNRIKNVKFFGFEFDLSKKISKFQAVINHLFPDRYKYISSGIHYEAVCIGRPIISPKNTTDSYFIEKYKNGLLYEYDDDDEIIRNVSELKKYYKEFKIIAEDISKKWNMNNGLEKVIDLTI